MNLNLLGSIELTASAAVVVSILAAGLAETARARATIVAGFGVWFSGVTALAAAGAFHHAGTAGTLRLGAALGLPILALVAAVATSEGVRAALKRIPVSSLVAANTVRILGISFVILYADGRLPAPFAPVAGWGDIAVGVTAPVVAWLVATRGRDARTPLLAWNIIGLLDLIVAVGLGVASTPGPFHVILTNPDAGLMTTLPWFLIPGFIVPTLIGTHLAVFYRLRGDVDSRSDVLARPRVATL
jgi:hypothetical protein